MRAFALAAVLLLLAPAALMAADYRLRLYGYTFKTDIHSWFDQAGGQLSAMYLVVLAFTGQIPLGALNPALNATSAQLVDIYTKGTPAALGTPPPYGTYQKLIRYDGQYGGLMYNTLFSGNPWTKPADIDEYFLNLLSTLNQPRPAGVTVWYSDSVAFFQFIQHTFVTKIAFDYWDRAITLVRKGKIEGQYGAIHQIDLAWAVFAGHNLTGPYANYAIGYQGLLDNIGTSNGVAYLYYGGDQVPGQAFMTIELAAAHEDAVAAARERNYAGIITAAKKTAAIYAQFGLQLLTFSSYSNDYAMTCANANATSTITSTAQSYQITLLNTTRSLITGLGLRNSSDVDELYSLNGLTGPGTVPLYNTTNVLVKRIVAALHNQSAELYMDDALMGVPVPDRYVYLWNGFGNQHADRASDYDLTPCTAPTP